MLKLFRQYWPRFLAFWLVSVVTMAGIVIGDACDLGPTVRVWGLVFLVLYFLMSFFCAHVLYVRREISAGQAAALYSPFIFMWVVVVIIRALVLSILGSPL